MSNLFARLIKYAPRENVTPLENFITELFCGIMEQCRNFREVIITSLCEHLEIPFVCDIQDWKIYTQYHLESGMIPDIVLLNRKDNNRMIIIENKVDSNPNPTQLRNYHKYLDSKNGYGLILLAKIHSIHPIDYNGGAYEVPFKAISWNEIVRIIRTSKENPTIKFCEEEIFLVDEFEKFLELQGVIMKEKFEPTDMVAMTNAMGIIELMNNALDGRAKKSLKELAPGGKLCDGAPRCTQLRDYGRYVDWVAYNEKTGNDINISMGFLLDQEKLSKLNTNGYPLAFISIEVNPKHKGNVSISEMCKKFVAQNSKWEEVPNTFNTWEKIYCGLNLKELEIENHIVQINEYWKERLVEIKELLQNMLK